MANFLNAGILGDGAGVANKRGFRSIATQNIDTPHYNAKYFETYPTVWASAYAFGKMLAAEGEMTNGGQPTRDQIAAMEGATEEWVSMFLLYYFGDLHLSTYDRSTVERDYDKDLWLAVSGTYPTSGDTAVNEIQLLETDAHTVVGGCYPETVFFPSRGRTQWTTDKKLSTYLVGSRLSWAKCSAALLQGERERRDFQGLLELIARHALPNKVFQDRLRTFIANRFSDRVEPNGTLPANPASWEILKQPEPSDVLKNYPLQKPNMKGGTIYYLVNGMPHLSDWMTASTAAGWPAPYQYVESGNNQLTVEFAGKRITCKLSENDDIVQIHKLFLADSPLWCKVPKASDDHISRIKSLHKIELRDPVLTDNDLAVCLTPLTGAYLEHFPEILRNLDQVYTTIDWQGTSVEWTIPVLGREVKWQTRPTFARALSGSSLRMWPPRVARHWHLYAAYGIGNKKDCGRWNLVDENGRLGEMIEIDDEYFSVSQSADGLPNRPSSLLLKDNEGKERGVLFLTDFQEQLTSGDGTATMAVDFGTSNTCIAYNDGDSKILKFKLTPEILWGKRPTLENPGFVPFDWGGHKGFFPTILLSRRNDEKLRDDLHPDHVGLEHLFKVDIPGLHKEMEERLSQGDFNRVWKMHPNPKWETSGTKPWRTLFLELTMLYAHAELFFNKGVKLEKYVFTFPLAFSKDERKSYHSKAKAALRKIRQYCYGTNPSVDRFEYVETVDESTAIAESIGAAAAVSTMDVFIDIGGGTADVAIRHNKRFLVLDSIKVAGNTFFRFGEKNFSNAGLHGASEFKKHLQKLLQGKDDGSEFKIVNPDSDYKLAVNYSVAINALDDEQFRDREMSLLKKTMGTRSYQKYRTRLFFRHILTYSLIQACAAVVEGHIKLSSGLKLVLGGNGWGLMVFADMPRSGARLKEEATEILKLLKRELLPSLTEEQKECLESVKIFTLELLNEGNLSKAKTDVALGALNANPTRQTNQSTTPFSGITVQNLRVNDFAGNTLHWYERWGFEEFKQKFGFMDGVIETNFDNPENQEKPIDNILSVFTCVGNTRTNQEDNMPAATWTNINGKLSDSIVELQGDRIEPAPINYFVSNVLYPQDSPRDVLDILASKNGQFRTDDEEE